MLTKVCTLKAMVFSVVMYGCENWTVKKAQHQRIDVFELWCWRRLLRVPWTARSSTQSILKEITPEYSLEGLMLKLQYFGHLMWTANSLEKTLMLEKTESKRVSRWKSLSHVWLFVTVHGVLQARILEWVAFPSPGDLPNPGIKPRSPTLWVDSLPAEPQGKPKNTGVGSLSLLQWIFLTQESNRDLSVLQMDSLPAELPGKPYPCHNPCHIFSTQKFSSNVFTATSQYSNVWIPHIWI